MIKAITFDCWDTLLDDDASRNRLRKEYIKKILHENGFDIKDDKINSLFSEEAKIFQDHIIKNRKTPNSKDRVDTILNLLDISLPKNTADAVADYCDRVAIESPPPEVDGVKNVLKNLKGVYKLAVICNTGWHSGTTVRELLHEKDFPGYFSHLTFSDEAGVAKPHKQIFQYTLEKLNESPDNAVHIGDSEYSDIVGAKEAGMKAILFTGINDRYRDNNTADAVINSYEGFSELIKNL